jgi:hypothetical protein
MTIINYEYVIDSKRRRLTIELENPMYYQRLKRIFQRRNQHQQLF